MSLSHPGGHAAAALVMSGLYLVPLGALATGGGHGHSDDIGQVGEAGADTRTVELVMSDNYFEPEALNVAPGETIQLTIKNEGAVVHSLSIGTEHVHEERQEGVADMISHGMLSTNAIDHSMMSMDMGDHGMDHDSGDVVFVGPGESVEFVWTFPTEGELEFACNMPGHYDSGMMGEIVFEAGS